MKWMLGLCVGIFFMIFGIEAFSNTVVTEYGVPITVQGDVYTTNVPNTPDYYYYSGHRCYTQKRDIAGATVLNLHAGVSGGTDIYCYDYP